MSYVLSKGLVIVWLRSTNQKGFQLVLFDIEIKRRGRFWRTNIHLNSNAVWYTRHTPTVIVFLIFSSEVTKN